MDTTLPQNQRQTGSDQQPELRPTPLPWEKHGEAYVLNMDGVTYRIRVRTDKKGHQSVRLEGYSKEGTWYGLGDKDLDGTNFYGNFVADGSFGKRQVVSQFMKLDIDSWTLDTFQRHSPAVAPPELYTTPWQMVDASTWIWQNGDTTFQVRATKDDDRDLAVLEVWNGSEFKLLKECCYFHLGHSDDIKDYYNYSALVEDRRDFAVELMKAYAVKPGISTLKVAPVAAAPVPIHPALSDENIEDSEEPAEQSEFAPINSSMPDAFAGEACEDGSPVDIPMTNSNGSLKSPPQLVQESLAKVGYLASKFIATQVALLLSQSTDMVNAMLIEGPPGAGKTALAKGVAKILKAQQILLGASSGTTWEDLLHKPDLVKILRAAAGDSNAVQNDSDVTALGFLPRLFKLSQTGPVVGILDELDKTDDRVDDNFLTALQEGKIDVPGHGIIEAKRENLFIFFTKNDRREISDALMRRCRRLLVAFPGSKLEKNILSGRVKSGELTKPLILPSEKPPFIPQQVIDKLIAVAKKLRDAYDRDEVIKPPATQELRDAGYDVVRLARWGRDALNLSGEVVASWLSGFQQDREYLRENIANEQQLSKDLIEAVLLAARKGN